MFHSSGYFKKTLCPFHEHGLCHRPHCHYSHKLPKPPASAKSPPLLKEKAAAPVPSQASLLNFDLSKIDDKVMSDVAMAISQVPNFFGSTSGGSAVSLPMRMEPSEEASIPSYAPEKCMGMSDPLYSSSLPPTSSEPRPLNTQVKAELPLTPSPEKTHLDRHDDESSQPSLLCGVSLHSQQSKHSLVTEADVFGGSVDDCDDGGVAEGDCEVAMKTEKGPELSQMEAEFNEVTALPASSRSKDSPSLKRKAGDDPYGSMLRKKWKSHSDSQIVREVARAAPKPTIKSNFSEMVSGTTLHMGKSRTAITKNVKTSVVRPKLPLTVNTRIPTSVRQKFLDAFIDEHLKMTSDPQQAYTTSLEEEKQLFDKSSKRMIYMNHSVSALRKLRGKVKTFLEEQKAKSDARVKIHSEQVKNKAGSARESRSIGKREVPKSAKGKDDAEPSKKRGWRELEAELQDTFFSEDMKSFSKQFDSKPANKIMDNRTKKQTASTMDDPGSSQQLNTGKSLSLEVDLFGESDSDNEPEEGGVATPTKSRIAEFSEDHDPGVSFETALFSVSTGKATKKKKKEKIKKAKSKERPSVDVRKRSGAQHRSGASDRSEQPARRSSVSVLNKVPVISLARTRMSSSESRGSPSLSSVGSLDSTHPPTDSRTSITNVDVPMTTDDVPITTSDVPMTTGDSVFEEIQPQEQVCLTTTESSSHSLLSPTVSFAPSGPFINLTKLATRKKPPPDVASIARSLGKKPVIKKSPAVKPSPFTIIKRKEIQFTSPVFYQYMCHYVLTESQLSDNGYPRPTEEEGVALINRGGATPPVIERVGESAKRHLCCRCHKSFVIYNDGKYQSLEECFYHYGRLFKSKEYGEGVVSKYTCCQGRRDSDGCQWAKLHVTSGELPSREGGYVTTSSGSLGNQCVYAVDCEMCYTTAGLQLTRVSVVDDNLSVVFEKLIKPSHPIVDYNTRFSGLKAEDFITVTTTLSEVQQELLSLIGSDTILVGHSLESDLRAMKVIHDRVVDTALVFPHKKGLPYKRSLKALMTEHLHKFIQNDIDGGHDSLEDSRACMELMIWKVKGDLKRDSRRSSDSK